MEKHDLLVIEPCYLSVGAQGMRPESIRTKGLWGLGLLVLGR